MANTIPVHVTIDHDVIRSWAARRGARPSQPQGDDRPWPLLFDLGPPDAGVVEIDWTRFFEQFERANLAFVYRDTGPDAELDDLHEFVKRPGVPELLRSTKSTIIERII